AIGNPARIVGMANVFEATFRVAIFDRPDPTSGLDPLGDQVVMATCGTGCWGTFDVTLPYRVTSAGWGVLRVYDLSAKDGSPENVTDYPVWLTPGR
ncbi:MAG: Gmad2 immunoglobulin-like domain-containing protein, partial [Chloroflexota bacterium]